MIDILLVEDNEDDIVYVGEAFKEARLANPIHVVRDGEEALSYLRHQGKFKDSRLPGLILLDINMPKKNGIEVLQDIKADPTLCHLPVIMLTTSERDVDITRSFSAGACSFIRKPVGFDELKIIIQQFEMYWALIAKLPVPKK